jgi:hypothetical protein
MLEGGVVELAAPGGSKGVAVGQAFEGVEYGCVLFLRELLSAKVEAGLLPVCPPEL